MTDFKKVTKWVFLGVVFAVLLYDFWVHLQQKDATISSVLLDESMRAPILPLIIGILLGHLFWPQKVSN